MTALVLSHLQSMLGGDDDGGGGGSGGFFDQNSGGASSTTMMVPSLSDSVLPWQRAFGSVVALHVVSFSSEELGNKKKNKESKGEEEGKEEKEEEEKADDSTLASSFAYPSLWINEDEARGKKSATTPVQPWSGDEAGRGVLLVGDVDADGKGGLPWPLPPFGFHEIGHAAAAAVRRK